MKTNFHTHIYRCGHAEGDVEDYIKEAIKNNFDMIGISDHGPLPKYLFDRMAMEELEDYFESILAIQDKYKNKIKIFTGLEIEYFPKLDYYYKKILKRVDYLILGAHVFTKKNKMYSSWEIKTKKDLKLFLEQILKAIDSGFFSFIAHPDIFLTGYPLWDEAAINATKTICMKAKKLGIPLEVNANGIRKGLKKTEMGLRYNYPREEFWEIAKKIGVKVIVNSDCHKVEELNDKSMKTAIELSEKWDLDTINFYK